MRAKQIWEFLPLPSKIKLVWQRITLSKLTTIYFLFSIFHFAVQLVLQAQAFDINATAATVLFNIVKSGNQFIDGFMVDDDNQFRVCESVPVTLSSADCLIVYPIGANDTNVYPKLASNATTTNSSTFTSTSLLASSTSTSLLTSSTSTSTTASAAFSIASSNSTLLSPSSTNATNLTDSGTKTTGSKRALEQTSVVVTTHGQTTNVTLNGFGWNGETVELTQACMVALNWPVEKLDNTKREDITSIAFEFWVLGMSVVALLNESIPHVVAALLTHVLASVWGAYQLVSTHDFKEQVEQLSGANGPCNINFLLTYWAPRQDAEIASLALNAAALLISAVLSWKLIKAFGWQTFKRIGASRTINMIYKIVLILSITLQLSLFFVVGSMALWIDQLYNGAIGHLAKNQLVFKALFIAASIALIPWMGMGWIAARREKRKTMAMFIILSFVYIALWGVIWISPTFRWTFATWPFFAAMVVIALGLLTVTFALGIVCRLNFGKGLPQYLTSMDPLPDDDFVSAMPDGYGEDPEKFAFPSDEVAIPTFSMAYGGKGETVPPPTQMHLAHTGGRHNSPIDTSMTMSRSSINSASSVTPSQRTPESHNAPSILGRHDSTASGRSGRSVGQMNRWVIE